MRVRYTPRARGDMDAILSYIDQRNPQRLIEAGGAEKVLDGLLACMPMEQLQEMLRARQQQK